MIKALAMGLALSGCAHNDWPSREPALGDKIIKNIPPTELPHFVGLKSQIADSDHLSRAWIYENCEERSNYVWQNHSWLMTYSLYRTIIKSGKWNDYKINPIGFIQSYKVSEEDEEYIEELRDDSIYWEEMDDLKDEECDS